VGQLLDGVTGRDRATELAQIRSERVGDAARPAPRQRPPDRIAGEQEHERERSGERMLQRQERMRRATSDERTRRFAVECRGEAARRAHGVEAETREEEWMP